MTAAEVSRYLLAECPPASAGDDDGPAFIGWAFTGTPEQMSEFDAKTAEAFPGGVWACPFCEGTHQLRDVDRATYEAIGGDVDDHEDDEL